MVVGEVHGCDCAAEGEGGEEGAGDEEGFEVLGADVGDESMGQGGISASLPND